MMSDKKRQKVVKMLYEVIVSNKLSFEEYTKLCIAISKDRDLKLPQYLLTYLDISIGISSAFKSDYVHLYIYLYDKMCLYPRRDIQYILNTTKKLIENNPYNWNKKRLEYMKERYSDFYKRYILPDKTDSTINSLYAMFERYKSHHDCINVHQKLQELKSHSTLYYKEYIKLKKDFPTTSIKDMNIKEKSNKEKTVLQHYLIDEDMILQAIKESPFIEFRMGKLETIYYFIMEYLEHYHELEELHQKLSELSTYKYKYEQLLDELKSLFFAISYQSKRDHHMYELSHQISDKEEDSIKNFNLKGIYYLLDEPSLPYEAMLKIAKRVESFSFHLKVKLFFAIEQRAKQDKNFRSLHIFLIPHFLQYSKKDINNISKSILSMIEKNPYKWSEERKEEFLQLSSKIIKEAQKAPKNNIFCLMMRELKKELS